MAGSKLAMLKKMLEDIAQQREVVQLPSLFHPSSHAFYKRTVPGFL